MLLLLTGGGYWKSPGRKTNCSIKMVIGKLISVLYSLVSNKIRLTGSFNHMERSHPLISDA